MGWSTIQQLANLFRSVAVICDEVGLPCLSQRFSREFRDQDAVGYCCCEEHRDAPQAAFVHMLAKLAPLAEALDRSGYHDLALVTVELALRFEPTLDLTLDHAYLLLLLGDNRDAGRVYSKVLRRHGSIPQEELQRLAELARTHAAEDDIAAFLTGLRRYARPQPAPTAGES